MEQNKETSAEEIKVNVVSDEQVEEPITEEAVTEDSAMEVETTENAPEAESENASEGFFGKKKKKEKKDKKDEQIEALNAKNEELQDKYLRLQAEFVNFRNRTDKEKAASFDLGAKSVVEKMLPVIDNLERGLAVLTDEQKEDAFAQGIDKVYKQLMATLEGMNVKPMESVGKEFDPNLHNAVMHVEDENVGENIVVEEFQKGYTYHDTVVRHAMVKVAN